MVNQLLRSLFCFGHLIHMGLTIVQHVYVMTGDDALVEIYCGMTKWLAYDIIFSIISFFISTSSSKWDSKQEHMSGKIYIHALSEIFSFFLAEPIDRWNTGCNCRETFCEEEYKLLYFRLHNNSIYPCHQNWGWWQSLPSNHRACHLWASSVYQELNWIELLLRI